jgi:hypothetical protein
MKLIDDARRTWHKLWSVRLALLSAALSAIEFALPLVPDSVAELIGRGRFAAAALVISLGSGLARVVSQPKLHGGEDD